MRETESMKVNVKINTNYEIIMDEIWRHLHNVNELLEMLSIPHGDPHGAEEE